MFKFLQSFVDRNNKNMNLIEFLIRVLRISEKSRVLREIPLSRGTLGVQKDAAAPKSYPSGEIQNLHQINETSVSGVSRRQVSKFPWGMTVICFQRKRGRVSKTVIITKLDEFISIFLANKNIYQNSVTAQTEICIIGLPWCTVQPSKVSDRGVERAQPSQAIGHITYLHNRILV